MKERVGVISDNSSATVLTMLEIWKQNKTVVMISMDTPKFVISEIVNENKICTFYCSNEWVAKYKECIEGVTLLAFNYEK